MKMILITEERITQLMDKLKLVNCEIREEDKCNKEHLAKFVHRKFHYELVKFFQDEGSCYPNER